jgi:pSer/pThr/pTyr-binding forkhead associated (FHA) protein
MALLEFLNGERVGQRMPLAGKNAILGRHPECDVVLDQGAVSRQHAQISVIDGEYFIEDLHSRNGTLVNGLAIDSRYKLSDGDEVKICDLALTFYRGNGPVAAAAASGTAALAGFASSHTPSQSLDESDGGFEVTEETGPVGHSSTVMFGFGTLSLLSIRGSAAPENISL